MITMALGIGAVIGNIRARMRFRHANGQDAIAGNHARQDAFLDGLRCVMGNDAGLHAGFTQYRHGGHVIHLGDFFEDQRGIKNGKAKPAIFFRHGHAKYAKSGELLDIRPGKGAIHPFRRILFEFFLRQFPDSGDHFPLFSADFEFHYRLPIFR